MPLLATTASCDFVGIRKGPDPEVPSHYKIYTDGRYYDFTDPENPELVSGVKAFKYIWPWVHYGVLIPEYYDFGGGTDNPTYIDSRYPAQYTDGKYYVFNKHWYAPTPTIAFGVYKLQDGKYYDFGAPDEGVTELTRLQGVQLHQEHELYYDFGRQLKVTVQGTQGEYDQSHLEVIVTHDFDTYDVTVDDDPNRILILATVNTSPNTTKVIFNYLGIGDVAHITLTTNTFKTAPELVTGVRRREVGGLYYYFGSTGSANLHVARLYHTFHMGMYYYFGRQGTTTPELVTGLKVFTGPSGSTALADETAVDGSWHENMGYIDNIVDAVPRRLYLESQLNDYIESGDLAYYNFGTGTGSPTKIENGIYLHTGASYSSLGWENPGETIYYKFTVNQWGSGRKAVKATYIATMNDGKDYSFGAEGTADPEECTDGAYRSGPLQFFRSRDITLIPNGDADYNFSLYASGVCVDTYCYADAYQLRCTDLYRWRFNETGPPTDITVFILTGYGLLGTYVWNRTANTWADNQSFVLNAYQGAKAFVFSDHKVGYIVQCRNLTNEPLSEFTREVLGNLY